MADEITQKKGMIVDTLKGKSVLKQKALTILPLHS